VFSIDISLSVCYIHTEIKKDLHTDESPKGKRKTMKKILTVLLVMVVAMGFVFADNEAAGNTHSLNLTASVGAVMEAHWAKAKSGTPTAETWSTSFASLDGGSGVSVDLTSSEQQSVGNFVYQTNNTTRASFKISGTVFSASGVNTTIRYDIYKTGAESKLVSAGETAVTLIAETGDTAKSGLRFGSQDVSIVVDADDVAVAAVGSYTATLTVATVAI
jgi:hypothetical protein